MNIIKGTALSDLLRGGFADDLIQAFDGQDTVYGGEGGDELEGGEGDDVLYGEGGIDLVEGEGGDDTVYGGDAIDVVDGGAGDDLVFGGDDMDYLAGGFGNDLLYGEAGDDVFGQDFGGSDTMVGGEGDDQFEITIGEGADVVDGGSGTDRVILNLSRDSVMMVQRADGVIEVRSLHDSETHILSGIETFVATEGWEGTPEEMVLAGPGSFAPVAATDAATVGEGGGSVVINVLANDTDKDSARLASDPYRDNTRTLLAINTAGTRGAVVLNADGTVSYAGPDMQSLRAGETLVDTFTYTMADGFGVTSTGTVNVTIQGENDAPTAVDDAITVQEGRETGGLAATLVANDRDPDSGDLKTIIDVDFGATKGGLIFDLASQQVIYFAEGFEALAAGQTATDSFRYTLRDGHGADSSALVTVTIVGENDAPKATADAAGVLEDATTGNLWSALLANDVDPDAGDSKTIVAVNTTGTKGAVAFDPNGALTYTASGWDALAAGATGLDTFTYTVRDASGAESTATVTMTITGTADNDGWIVGGPGNDWVIGGPGQDTLHGGAGADTLVGGGGDDVFVFRPGEVHGDRVHDFGGRGNKDDDLLIFQGFGEDAYLTRHGNQWTVHYGDNPMLTETFWLNTPGLVEGVDYIFV